MQAWHDLNWKENLVLFKMCIMYADDHNNALYLFNNFAHIIHHFESLPSTKEYFSVDLFANK